MSLRFRIFLDMDGVVVDFDGLMRHTGLTGDELKKMKGAYLEMKPIAGALEGVRRLMSIAGQYGGEVWLATKPPTGIPWAYADKVSWVLHYLSELKRRIIITHDKGLLGGADDYLVDDRPWRANCASFRGTLIQFSAVGAPLAPPPADSSYNRPTAILCGWPTLVDRLHDGMKRRADEGGASRAVRHLAQDFGIDPDHSLEDINAARDLMRLGPIRAESTPSGDSWVTMDRASMPADSIGFNVYKGGELRREVRWPIGMHVVEDPSIPDGTIVARGANGSQVTIKNIARPAHGGYPGGPFPTSPAGRYGGGRYGSTPVPRTLHGLALRDIARPEFVPVLDKMARDGVVLVDKPCVNACQQPLVCSGQGKCVRAGLDSPIGRYGNGPEPDRAEERRGYYDEGQS